MLCGIHLYPRGPQAEKSCFFMSPSESENTDDKRQDVHNVGNVSGNLHKRACGSKRAGDMFRVDYFTVGQRPAAQMLIQLRRDERHRNGFMVHGGSCTEIASDVERPSGILKAESLTTNCAPTNRTTWQNVVHKAQLRSIIPA